MQAKERGMGKEVYTVGLRLNARHAKHVNAIPYFFSHGSKIVYYSTYSKNINLQFTTKLLQFSNCVTVTWEKQAVF